VKHIQTVKCLSVALCLLSVMVRPAPISAHGTEIHNQPAAGIDSDTSHLERDVAPTASEEAGLLERVERERLGINPNTLRTARMQANPGQVGEWGSVQDWPVNGTFTSVMPDGRVLAFDSVNDLPTEQNPTHTFTRAMTWTPSSGAIQRLDADTGWNLFCAGFATLPDGRTFIAGGNRDAALNGIEQTHTFNHLSNTWARGQRMDFSRWYPSITPLANGEMLITGGGVAISEVREVDGQIRQLTGASASIWNNRIYPWLQTAPDGRVLFLGPARQLGVVATSGAGTWQPTAVRDSQNRSYGSYAMYDVGRVLVAGGFASNAQLVDLNNSVFAAELWNPATGQWTVLAEEERARQYHSTATLLPDGRVLSAGGGICGICQQTGYMQRNAQVFSPPYLFNSDGSGTLADRPQIDALPARVRYNQRVNVSTAQAASIAKVALIRTSSVTHSQNMEQRYLPLQFEFNVNALNVQMPANANLAPPGHYMLFIIDNNGVPSVAPIIRISESTQNPTPVSNAANYALTGAASASDNNVDASLAIDGVTDGNFANGSVYSAEQQNQPWWQVDLGETRDIAQIALHRRTDCCEERLSGIHILVSSSPLPVELSEALATTGVSEYYIDSFNGSEKRIDLNQPGRYVRIQLAGNSRLELAEVNVMGDTDSGGGDPDISISVNDTQVSESDGTAAVTVSLSESSSSTVSALVHTRNDSAIGGTDYYGKTETLTFQPGQTSQSFTFTLVDDSIGEPSETMLVRIAETSGADIANQIATVTINDDDTNSVRPELSVVGATVNEGDGSVSATVRLSEATGSAVSLLIFTQLASATPGTDYYGRTESLTIPAGSTTGSFTIQILDDAVPESTETILVRATGVQGDVDIVQDRDIIEILDNDTNSGRPELSVLGATVNEGDGSASATVRLSEAAGSAVSLLIFTQLASATPGTDYYGRTESLTIPAGSTTGSFNIQILDDGATESTETILVRATSVQGDVDLVQDRDIIEILDND